MFKPTSPERIGRRVLLLLRVKTLILIPTPATRLHHTLHSSLLAIILHLGRHLARSAPDVRAHANRPAPERIGIRMLLLRAPHCDSRLLE